MISDPGFWGLEYAQRRGWVPAKPKENEVKYQIRKENNSVDPSMVMFNIYKLSPKPLYLTGFGTLEAAMKNLEKIIKPASEVVYEIEVPDVT
jgi:hypothetical protein